MCKKGVVDIVAGSKRTKIGHTFNSETGFVSFLHLIGLYIEGLSADNFAAVYLCHRVGNKSNEFSANAIDYRIRMKESSVVFKLCRNMTIKDWLKPQAGEGHNELFAHSILTSLLSAALRMFLL